MDIIEFFKHLGSALMEGKLPEWGIWSYLILAVLVAVEGPIATLLGAAAASTGVMKPAAVFIAAAAGNLSADTLWYSLGYLGKVEWFQRFGGRLGINMAYLEKLERSLHAHAARLLFFAKLSVGPMIPSLIATGLIKVPWRRWFPAVFAGEMIWTGSLIMIGFYGIAALQKVERGIETVILLGSVAFLLLILWMGRRILKKSQKDTDEPAPTQEQDIY